MYWPALRMTVFVAPAGHGLAVSQRARSRDEEGEQESGPAEQLPASQCSVCTPQLHYKDAKDMQNE